MASILEELKAGLHSLLDHVAGDDDGPVPEMSTEAIRQRLEQRAAARAAGKVGKVHQIALRASSSPAARKARERIARKRETRVHRRLQEREERAARDQAAAFEAAKQQAAHDAAFRGFTEGAGWDRARKAKEAVLGQDKTLAAYYKTLNLPYGATFPEVKAAFRKLMRKYHPDMHSQSPDKQKAAAELSKKLTVAYNALESHLGG